MDTSAEIRAIFDTRRNGTTAVAAKSQWLTLTNSKLTVGQKTFQDSRRRPPAGDLIAHDPVPVPRRLQAYAGSCSTNNPALAPTNNTPCCRPTRRRPGRS